MSAVLAPHTPERRLLARPASLGRRRPVLSFLGLILGICLVLLAVGRSGVAAPQVGLQLTGDVQTDDPTSFALTYSLVNRGLRPVEVQAAGVAGEVRLVPRQVDLHDADVHMAARADDFPSFAPFTMAGGSHQTFVIEVPCVEAGGATAELTIDVRSADLGLRETLTELVGDPMACL
jgi:hypothetical protein